MNPMWKFNKKVGTILKIRIDRDFFSVKLPQHQSKRFKWQNILLLNRDLVSNELLVSTHPVSASVCLSVRPLSPLPDSS